ncbi:SDR family NAD(P)-dependent oxidoreductase [Brachybacterium massiliense]|uniref:SDR family NAD(P)-dependent oxidoreductase n=1 Tax=Brachybacterium massiliense TaxID=1755098 RepID=UPI000B3BC9AD|nr:SDR family oxidoreductase [Brachybacterium massiliense]
MQLQDNVFVVTGGGNGMGRQIALQLAARGARVAAADLNEDGLAETVRMVDADGRVTAHPLNVTDRTAVDALPDAVIAAHGRVDGIVNIAGIIHRFVPYTDLTADEEERIMNVNFWGTVNMCRTFLPVLKARPAAAIVNMSSLSALIPFAGQTLYGASKGAVKQFSEGLYAELIDTNIAVTTLFPGNISTNLTGNSGVAMIDPKGQKVRSTTPEEAGRIIVAGIEKGSFRVLVGADARLLDRLARMDSRRTTRLVAKQMKSVL